MHIKRILASASAFAAIAIAGSALANEQADPTVQTLRLDPHGKPSGVILSDGTELVGVPGSNFASVVTPGDPVRVVVNGHERLVLINGRTFETAVIGANERAALRPLLGHPVSIGGGPMATDADQTYLDDATSLQRFAVVSRVALVLETRVGARAGLLLEDGTQVHLVPRLAGSLANIEPGDRLRVEGLGTPAQHGSAMWALSIADEGFVYLDVERGRGAPEIGVTGPFSSE